MYSVYEKYGVAGLRLVGQTASLREAARIEICAYGNASDAMAADFSRTEVFVDGNDIVYDKEAREIYQDHIDEQCGVFHNIYTDAIECPDI